MSFIEKLGYDGALWAEDIQVAFKHKDRNLSSSGTGNGPPARRYYLDRESFWVEMSVVLTTDQRKADLLEALKYRISDEVLPIGMYLDVKSPGPRIICESPLGEFRLQNKIAEIQEAVEQLERFMQLTLLQGEVDKAVLKYLGTTT